MTDEPHRPHRVIPVFAFTDLSVRQEGSYHLRFNLFEIIAGEAIHHAEAYTMGFKVYTAKEFPGMQTSTPFTDLLRRHGLRVRTCKSSRTTKKRRHHRCSVMKVSSII